MTLPTYNPKRGSIEILDQAISFRGVNLSDLEYIITTRPNLFGEIAEAIENSDGSDAGVITELVTKFGDLAALVVAVSSDEDDTDEAVNVIKTWPLGVFSSAVFKVYELTVEGNELAKKSLQEIHQLLMNSPASETR